MRQADEIPVWVYGLIGLAMLCATALIALNEILHPQGCTVTPQSIIEVMDRNGCAELRKVSNYEGIVLMCVPTPFRIDNLSMSLGRSSSDEP